MNHWLVKSEPGAYSWDNLNEDKKTAWTGVRNYAARNFLRDMKKGDLVMFYHSGGAAKEVIGIAKVAKEFYQDPTSEDANWVAVEIAPFKKLKKPVSLEQVKADKRLKDIGLVRLGRLSVMPLKAEEFDTIIELSQ